MSCEIILTIKYYPGGPIYYLKLCLKTVVQQTMSTILHNRLVDESSANSAETPALKGKWESLPLAIILHGGGGLKMRRAYMIFVADVADIVCGAKKIMWSNFAPHDACHCDQNCSTWQAILHHMTKLLVMWGNLPLLHMTNLQCILSYHDLHSFDAKSILSRFTQFCVEQNLILSVEQKWHISCMVLVTRKWFSRSFFYCWRISHVFSHWSRKKLRTAKVFRNQWKKWRTKLETM